MIAPTQPNERILIVDVLRGFALFGILLVNIGNFSQPDFYTDTAGINLSTGTYDVVAQWFVSLFAQGKFYPMFSFLFGFGAIIFLERGEEKGQNAVRLYKRRLGFLLCIGIVHAVLIWSGDILVMYSLIGFLLLWFRRKEPRVILTWALWLLLTPIAVLIFLNILFVFAVGGQSDPGLAAEAEKLVEESLAAYGQGTYLDMIRQRLRDLSYLYSYSLFAFPDILALFLFGVYAAKKRILHDVVSHLVLITRVWKSTLFLGVILIAIHAVGEAGRDLATPSMYDVLSLVSLLSGSVLSFFYMSSIALLLQKPKGRVLLSKLAPVGRMAMTNYLMQSVVCTTLFYNYGLGLYGKMTPFYTLLIAILLYVLQMAISSYWMARHRYGPMELLWRRLTYGKRLEVGRQ